MFNAQVLPKYKDFLKPTLEVLAGLGDSGSNDEIEEALAHS